MEVTPESFKVLLERAELKPTPEDEEIIRNLFGRYVQRLSKFREYDLSGEEVAGTFNPANIPAK